MFVTFFQFIEQRLFSMYLCTLIELPTVVTKSTFFFLSYYFIGGNIGLYIPDEQKNFKCCGYYLNLYEVRTENKITCIITATQIISMHNIVTDILNLS